MIITRKFVFVHSPKTGGAFTHIFIRNVHAELSPFYTRIVGAFIHRFLAFNRFSFLLALRLDTIRLKTVILIFLVYISHKALIRPFLSLRWSILDGLYGWSHLNGRSVIPKSSQHRTILIGARNPFAIQVAWYFFNQLHLPPEKRTYDEKLAYVALLRPQAKGPQKSFAEAISLHLDPNPKAPWRTDKLKLGEVAGLLLSC